LSIPGGSNSTRTSIRGFCALDRPGIQAVPLAHRATPCSYQLHHREHRDPADRLLKRILEFSRKRAGQQGFTIEV